MCDTGLKIKSLITLHNLTINDVAYALEITPPTLRVRLKDGNFKYREIMKLIEVLKIERPEDIFFKTNSCCEATSA